MVLAPRDIQTRVAEKDATIVRRVKELETKIDEFLLGKAPSPGEGVQYGLPMDEQAEVIDRIIKDYTDAGWSVERYQGHVRDACNDIVFRYKQ